MGDAFRRMYRSEGVASFYKGLGVRLVYVMPSAAVSFFFYEQFRGMLNGIGVKPSHRRRRHDDDDDDNDDSDDEEEEGNSSSKSKATRYFYASLPLLAGGFMRAFGSTVRTPFDVVRSRLQVAGALRGSSSASASSSTTNSRVVVPHPRQYRNTFDAVLRVYASGELFVGLLPTIMRDIPFSCFYMLTYEGLKAAQHRCMMHFGINGSSSSSGENGNADASTTTTDSRLARANLGTVNFLLAGAGAATTACVLTAPLDLAKTKLQTQSLLTSRPPYTGVVDCLRHVVATEGYRGLARGLPAKLFTLVPGAAITFASYEAFKRVFFASDKR
jgi:hypothetical protein